MFALLTSRTCYDNYNHNHNHNHNDFHYHSHHHFQTRTQTQHSNRIVSSIATNHRLHLQLQQETSQHPIHINTYTHSSQQTTTPSSSSSSSSSSSLFSAEDNNFPNQCDTGFKVTTEVNNGDSNDYMNEDNHHLQQRSYSPPTPCPSIWSSFDAKHIPDSQELLQLLEPNPVFPPSYDTLPPGGCPRFPVLQPLSSFEEAIYTNLHSHQQHASSPATRAMDPAAGSSSTTLLLNITPKATTAAEATLPPSYSPSIYKIGIVSRKLEWVNPYEMSTNRSWKYLICELNSTQLNFYNIPPSHEDKILDFVSNDNKTLSLSQSTARIPENDSILTSDFDHRFYNFVKRQGLLEDVCAGSKKKGLVRTYTLQHARVGLATDYQKRVNVLRLRIESEQILLHFESTQDLIDWNMLLAVGKDIAIDINERELPKYRTVPRRRRRRGSNRRRRSAGGGINNRSSANHSSSSSSNIHFSRYTSTSDQFANTRNMLKSVSDANKIKGRFNKLRSKFSSSRLRSSSSPSPSPSPSTPNGDSEYNDDSRTSRFRSGSNYSDLRDRGYSMTEPQNHSLQGGRNYEPDNNVSHSSSYANSFDDDDEDDVEDYDEEFNEVLRRSRHETLGSTSPPPPSIHGNYDDQEDIQSMSDLRIDEDEEDGFGEGDGDEDDDDEQVGADEYEQEDDEANGFLSMARSRGVFAIGAPERKARLQCTTDNDFKWNPCPNESYSKRRYYRNCLRCIKPLTMEDSWVYKPLVKPTPFSPLNVAYLKAVKYAGPNGEVLPSASSTVSVPNSGVSSSNASFTSSHRKYGGGAATAALGVESTLMLPDTALTKLPNHFLKEFSVGPHGLVPKEII